MIPGIGSAAGAAATFACVYLTRIMFLNMILALAKKGVVVENLGTVSEKDLKSVLADQTPTRKNASEAFFRLRSEKSMLIWIICQGGNGWKKAFFLREQRNLH